MKVAIGLVCAALLAVLAWPSVGFADSRSGSTGTPAAEQSAPPLTATVMLPPAVVALDPLTPPVDPDEEQNLAAQVVPTMVVLAPDVTADGAPRPAQPGYADGVTIDEFDLFEDCVTVDQASDPSPSATPLLSPGPLPSVDASPIAVHASAEPTPQPTASAEPTPQPTATAEPTASAEPTATAEPTAEATPRVSDAPTPSQTPSATSSAQDSKVLCPIE